jgi:hypothetical protein
MTQLFRISTLFFILLSIISGVSLFLVSQSVQQSENKKQKLENALLYEQKTIRVLKAEWDYLNNPGRLEKLTAEYLDLVPADVQNVVVNGALLPDYAAPIMPLRKPEYKKDSVFHEISHSGTKAENITAPRPSIKPHYNAEPNFQQLIERLSKEEGSND